MNKDDTLIQPSDGAPAAQVEVSPDMARIYVDGMSALAYGPILSKIYLYLDDPLKRTSEIKFHRHVIQEIIMPTESLIDLSLAVLSSVETNRHATEEILGKFIKKLAGIKFGEQPQNEE